MQAIYTRATIDSFSWRLAAASSVDPGKPQDGKNMILQPGLRFAGGMMRSPLW